MLILKRLIDLVRTDFMRIEKIIVVVFLVLYFSSCDEKVPNCPDSEILAAVFTPLPENRITEDQSKTITARYINPVSRYSHGILGDAIEAGSLLVTHCDKTLVFQLDSLHVFEDLQPRLFDFKNDGIPEVITILSSMSLGASVAVFEIGIDSLSLVAQSEYIGRFNRWLNIACINDLDNDGIVEIAWVSTPHIGGILKIGQIEDNSIRVIDSYSGVSNHQIHSSNLDLSLITENEETKILYLPNNEFTAVLGFQFANNQIFIIDSVSMPVDPLIPLSDQFIQ